MESLPAEMVLSVFRHLDAPEVMKNRLVCQKFNGIIEKNRRALDRPTMSVRVFHDDGLMIEMRRHGFSRMGKLPFESFDFSFFNAVNIESIEFSDLACHATLLSLFNQLLSSLMSSRQFLIRSLSFSSVKLSDEFVPVLAALMDWVMPTCENLYFDGCELPEIITAKHIDEGALSRYRWFNCSSAQSMNNQIIEKFTQKMSEAKTRENFHADLNGVSIETACDFIQTWLNHPTASFFNLTLFDCNGQWKQDFFAECARRSMSHFCLEFPSKIHPCSHIKVVFDEITATCRIWPIFDVPARTAGTTYCNARYFRDF